MAKTPTPTAMQPVRRYVTRRGKLVNSYWRAQRGLRHALGKRV